MICHHNGESHAGTEVIEDQSGPLRYIQFGKLDVPIFHSRKIIHGTGSVDQQSHCNGRQSSRRYDLREIFAIHAIQTAGIQPLSESKSADPITQLRRLEETAEFFGELLGDRCASWLYRCVPKRVLLHETLNPDRKTVRCVGHALELPLDLCTFFLGDP